MRIICNTSISTAGKVLQHYFPWRGTLFWFPHGPSFQWITFHIQALKPSVRDIGTWRSTIYRNSPGRDMLWPMGRAKECIGRIIKDHKKSQKLSQDYVTVSLSLTVYIYPCSSRKNTCPRQLLSSQNTGAAFHNCGTQKNHHKKDAFWGFVWMTHPGAIACL